MQRGKKGQVETGVWFSAENFRRLRQGAKQRGVKYSTIINEALDDWFKFQSFYEWKLNYIPDEHQTPYYAMGRFCALYWHLTGEDLAAQHRKLCAIIGRAPRMPKQMKDKCRRTKFDEEHPELKPLMEQFGEDQCTMRKMTEAEALQFEFGYWHERNKISKGREKEIKPGE